MAAIAPAFNFKKWIDEHRHLLKPPVMNQVVYKDNDDFIVMVVGGPNKRKDFHYNETEEFFYQLEGNIVVKIVEDGKIRDININEGDSLLAANLTSGSSEIVMALKSGRAIRFNESTVRPMGRTATGVRGITLEDEADEVVGMISIDDPETTVLVVSEKGYGKRTDIDDYRVTNRGGKGVKTLNVTDKTGKLVAIKGVTDKDDLMIINKSGIIIRIAVSELRTMGRATQGVRLITLKENDEIASVAKIEHDEEEEGKDIETNNENDSEGLADIDPVEPNE